MAADPPASGCVIGAILKTVLGSALVLLGQFAMFDGDLAGTGAVITALGLLLMSSGILPFHLPGLSDRKPFLSRASAFRVRVVVNGFRADPVVCRVALGALVLCWAGGVYADSEGQRGVAVTAYLAFWPIFAWLVVGAGGLYRIEARRFGLQWNAGGSRRLLPWGEAKIARVDGDTIEFTSGDRLPLRHFAVDPQRFASAVRTFTDRPRLRETTLDGAEFMRRLGAPR
ncbi:hypothetical protein DVA67_026775 [Solirubrobacter sp. CPCC 204708]|uniref:PH domain-containing protein n=1 Tax=Solirubrobacter deserti TaxID=2282478 RepID=A0ABT4RGM5_9ACTN|nr:hypothetical protein [Solirubrobacter deserti]MBE2319601.1 hypothetical protein [Solirubrobacter deserti]MDA0137660.1 hypothetical protein [Solirubrobacter deserti]